MSKLQHLSGKGDILEFGVCSGVSTCEIAQAATQRRVIGFDHFQGLEQTKKSHYHPTWNEGAFRVGSYESVLDRTSRFSNIHLVIEDIHKLKDPISYGIRDIVAVHIDVDIYEPTVSSLNFIEKCRWNQLLIRFDDWHGHKSEHGFDMHERLACKEWLVRNNYHFSIPYNGHSGCVIVSR